VPQQALRCGNCVALEVAWQLDGAESVAVCAVLCGERASGVRAPDELRPAGLEHACATLEPQWPQ